MSADAASLAREIRRRLGPVPQLSDWPLVSIVVLNRDGAPMLRRLLTGLVEYTDYPNLELILVDNGSSDDSLDFIRRVDAPFPVSIVANQHNESFSDGCNRGAELASGDLLLFLNNDIEPFEPGWLRELVACRRSSDAGAVAATLVCLEEEHKASFRYGYGVQHRGLAFREEDGMIHPALHGWEEDPLDDRLGEDIERGAVAAACVLVGRDAFERLGGFTHGYVYGAEDIDLCFKLRAAGHGVLCSGRSVAIHHPVSTRRTAPFEEERARKHANRRVLWERWGPQLRREYECDRLNGGGIWAEESEIATDGADSGQARHLPPSRAEVEAFGFCLRATDPSTVPGLGALATALRKRGHACLILEGERVEADQGLNYDVALHAGAAVRCIPKPAQLDVFWDIDSRVALGEVERSRFDLTITGYEDADRFAGRLVTAVESLASAVGYRRRIDGRQQ